MASSAAECVSTGIEGRGSSLPRPDSTAASDGETYALMAPLVTVPISPENPSGAAAIWGSPETS